MVDLDVDRRPGAPARRRPDEEFDAFYEATSPSLLGQLYAFCGDLAEAEDCLQEAYVRTWQRWRRVSRYDNPAGFVRTVAWRLAVSRWHRARTGTLAWARHGPAPAVPGPSADAGRAGLGRRRLTPGHAPLRSFPLPQGALGPARPGRVSPGCRPPPACPRPVGRCRPA